MVTEYASESYKTSGKMTTLFIYHSSVKLFERSTSVEQQFETATRFHFSIASQLYTCNKILLQ